jgi:mannose-6-phosphate isomerase-like protein (cupin superfamily)
MAVQHAIKIPDQVLGYLRVHHVLTIGTGSFTGMPHAATTAFVADAEAIYFSMPSSELTLRNIDANQWASFTIDDYTPDFRKVRELRGVGVSGPVRDAENAAVVSMFAEKFPGLSTSDLTNLHHVSPLEVHFVDYEYTEGISLPLESSIVYEAAPQAAAAQAISTQLDHLTFEPGEVIVQQGTRSERFFIIVEGEIEVRREGHGQDVIVTRHGPGQFFGEVGALTGAPQEATFSAATRATVLAVDRSSFQDLATQSARADIGRRARDRDDFGAPDR